MCVVYACRFDGVEQNQSMTKFDIVYSFIHTVHCLVWCRSFHPWQWNFIDAQYTICTTTQCVYNELMSTWNESFHFEFAVWCFFLALCNVDIFFCFSLFILRIFSKLLHELPLSVWDHGTNPKTRSWTLKRSVLKIAKKYRFLSGELCGSVLTTWANHTFELD